MTQPQHSPSYLGVERHADGKKSAFSKTTFRGDHALGGEYIGFPDLLTNMLAKLNDAWPGFSLGVDKVVADDKNVCVFCTITADGGLIGKGVHSFVVEDGLEVSFDLYWDSAYWAKHAKI